MQKKLKKRNFRDLSYLVNQEGFRLRPGIFYRSSHLYKLSKKEKEAILSLRLETLLDLRTDGERMKKADEEGLATNYLHYPFVKDSTLGITHEKGLKGYVYPPDMHELYAKIVTEDEAREGLSKSFHSLLSVNSGPRLWHCSAGKDRAGLLAALFLLLLGYKEEDILKDYELSNRGIRAKGRLYQILITVLLWKPRLGKGVYKAMCADRSYLLFAFDAIKEKWSDYQAYFKEHLGITEEEVDTFKDVFLIKA